MKDSLITFQIQILVLYLDLIWIIYKHNIDNVYIVASRALCKNNVHLSVAVKGIIDYAGEGVILRKTRSRYEGGRSNSLIKLKVCTQVKVK